MARRSVARFPVAEGPHDCFLSLALDRPGTIGGGGLLRRGVGPTGPRLRPASLRRAQALARLALAHLVPPRQARAHLPFGMPGFGAFGPGGPGRGFGVSGAFGRGRDVLAVRPVQPASQRPDRAEGSESQRGAEDEDQGDRREGPGRQVGALFRPPRRDRGPTPSEDEGDRGQAAGPDGRGQEGRPRRAPSQPAENGSRGLALQVMGTDAIHDSELQRELGLGRPGRSVDSG